MQAIFGYSDYREFLKDYYEEQKSKKTGFTYARFSSLAGLGSPNYYKLVMDGQKNLTPTNLVKFSLALKLDDTERDFFEALVQYNQSSSKFEEEYFARKLKRLRENCGGTLSKRVIEEYEFESVSSWTHHAVMLLTNLRDFRASPRWISKKLYGLVSETEVATILVRLEAIGLLTRDPSGRLRQTHKRVRTRADLKRQSVQNFYRGILERAAKAVNIERPESREFGAYMVGLSARQIPELKKRVREFMDDLNEWALKNQDPEQIFAFVFSGFPLSTLGEEKEWVP
ncbi:MAG: TIGR02147 family protein [Calothrix sp. SM1_5_4]|nr:TIGR02147 family protein [Calothrix sp. SM1_5_4]